MLMRSFDFTTADLSANRAGMLSERQQKAVTERSLRLRRLALWLIGVPGVLFGVLLTVLLAMVGAQTQPATDPTLIVITSVLMVVSVVLVALPTLQKLTTYSASKRISKVSGKAHLLALPVATPFFRPIFGTLRASAAVYRLKVGTVSFRLSAEMLGLITADADYTVYYIHNTGGNQILSLERTVQTTLARDETALSIQPKL